MNRMFLLGSVLAIVVGLAMIAWSRQAEGCCGNLSNSSYNQDLFDENTTEVCADGIVYYFGLQGNRSWFHPKVTTQTKSGYVLCPVYAQPIALDQ